MSDHEAALWAQETADMPTKKNFIGFDGDGRPCFEDVVAPPAPRKQGPKKRRARPRNLTLTPEASAKLDALAEEPGSPGRSAIASAAILAYESKTSGGREARPEACPQCDSGDVTGAYRCPPGTWKCQACGNVWQTRRR